MSYPNRTTSAGETVAPAAHPIYIPNTFIGRRGTVQFGSRDDRPVHGGIHYRGASNGARAARRRAEREAKRLARREGGTR